MAATVFRDDNNIYVSGDLRKDDYKNVLRFIYQAINKAGYSDINLDFSRCDGAFSSAMLPLCAFIQKMRAARVDFSLELPGNERLSRLFRNTGWAYLIEPRAYDKPAIRSTRGQIPVMHFQTSDEQQQVVDALVEGMLHSIGGLSRQDFAAVEWSLNELTDNVLNHSSSKDGGLVQMSIFKDRARAIDITVCDAGLGIPTTLRDAYKDIPDEISALEWAVKEGVTRNKQTNQGNGLFGTFEICRVAKGSFEIHSGHAVMELSNGIVKYKNEPGFSIRNF